MVHGALPAGATRPDTVAMGLSMPSVAPAARVKVERSLAGEASSLPAQADAARASARVAATAARRRGRGTRILAGTENLRSVVGPPVIGRPNDSRGSGSAPYNRSVMRVGTRPPGEGRRALPAGGVGATCLHAGTAGRPAGDSPRYR